MGAYQISGYAVTGGHSPVTAGYQDELWAAQQCREAISALERAMVAPPMQMAREMKTAERTLEKISQKITEWQQNSMMGQNQEWATILARLSAAQSLIATYPTLGVRRRTIEQARKLVKSILIEGLY